MSEDMRQAGTAADSGAFQQEPDPDKGAIGISDTDLTELGDLSVLQEQDLDLAGPSTTGTEESSSSLEAELSSSGAGADGMESGGTSVQTLDFQTLTPSVSGAGSEAASIDMLMDVPLKVTVELGRTKMIIREVLDLQKGSVVELDRMAGEVVDVFINERLIAKGEVVVVDDKFGVRITEMLGSFARGNNAK